MSCEHGPVLVGPMEFPAYPLLSLGFCRSFGGGRLVSTGRPLLFDLWHEHV